MPNDFTPPAPPAADAVVDAPSADTTSTEISNTDSSNSDASGADASADDSTLPEQKAEEPKKEEFKKEEPKKEEPKKEDSKPEEKNPETKVDTSKWDIKIPEGLFVTDKEAHQEFLDICAKENLSEAQAQNLISFYANHTIQALEKSISAGTKKLKSEWGMEYGKNVELATRTVTLLNKQLNGELVQMLNSTQLSQHPETLKLFKIMGDMLSEDALGANHMANSFEPSLSNHDFMKSVFKQG